MEADHGLQSRGHPDPGPPRALWGGAVGWAQDGCPGRWGQAGRMHCPCWAGGPGAVGTPLSVTFPAKGFTLGQLTASETLHIVLGCSRLPVGRCAGGGPCPVDVFRRWTRPRVQRPWSHATAASMQTSPPDFLPPAWPRPHPPAAATTGHRGRGSGELTGWKEPGPVSVEDAHSLTW